MGNCVRRETGLESDANVSNPVNLDEIKKRISNMKNTWKERFAEKDKVFKKVKSKQNNIMDQINNSDNENSEEKERENYRTEEKSEISNNCESSNKKKLKIDNIEYILSSAPNSKKGIEEKILKNSNKVFEEDDGKNDREHSMSSYSMHNSKTELDEISLKNKSKNYEEDKVRDHLMSSTPNSRIGYNEDNNQIKNVSRIIEKVEKIKNERRNNSVTRHADNKSNLEEDIFRIRETEFIPHDTNLNNKREYSPRPTINKHIVNTEFKLIVRDLLK